MKSSFVCMCVCIDYLIFNMPWELDNSHFTEDGSKVGREQIDIQDHNTEKGHYWDVNQI